MSRKSRSGRIALSILAAILTVATGVLIWFVVPFRPGDTASLSFEGYIPLPREHLLNSLDCVSIYGRTLFVTSETSGNVFVVDLDANSPALAHVDTISGEGEAHGVVMDASSGLGFVTRSGTNRVDVFDPRSPRTVNYISVADDVDGVLSICCNKQQDRSTQKPYT